MLEVQNIDVFYGDLQVLWDVSFTVEEGEIVALVGANGSGKSTTLKAISGLLNPANGSISFLDQRLDQIPANKIIEHGVAHVPEALEPGRQPLLEAGGDQHMGVAEFHEARAFRVFDHATLERHGTQFVDLSSARPHGSSRAADLMPAC